MTQDEAVDLLDELLARDSGMTAWELDFIESLDKQRDGTFSEKQIAVLEKIEARFK